MDPEEVMEGALVVLGQRLHLSEDAGPTTHIAIRASNLEHDDVPPALGRYFVGVLLGAVDEDASLSREFLDTDPDYAAEVRRHIQRKIGETNNFSGKKARHFRDHVRNPYIAEVLAHSLLVLRKRSDTACLVGPTVALKQPHPEPRRQGIDLVGIYNDAGTAVPAIGEAKASKKYGSVQLTNAAGFFSSLDAGERGVEVRADLGALRHVLAGELRAGFAAKLWRERCCYLPIIVHGESVDVLKDHDGLGDLRPAQDHIRLVGLGLKRFNMFFNSVADEIRNAQDEFFS